MIVCIYYSASDFLSSKKCFTAFVFLSIFESSPFRDIISSSHSAGSFHLPFQRNHYIFLFSSIGFFPFGGIIKGWIHSRYSAKMGLHVGIFFCISPVTENLSWGERRWFYEYKYRFIGSPKYHAPHGLWGSCAGDSKITYQGGTPWKRRNTLKFF